MANLTTSVRRAVKSMSWLEDSDAAAVDLALKQAQAIENAAKFGDDEMALRVVARVGPHLLETLKALGGTPADRRALGVESQAKGRLAEIRALRSAQ